MEYQLDAWESGTLVSPAKVDLTTGIVTPAVYEGNTPITPERLEIMNQGIKKLYEEGAISKDIYIGPEEEAPEEAKIIIDSNQMKTKSSEVVDSLEGNEIDKAPSVKAINNEFSLLKGKILWTNPNPTNEFNGQSITVNNLSDYDLIEIMYRKSTTEFYINSTKFPNIVGGGTTLLIPNTATTGVTYFRFASIEEGNVIKFTTGTNPGIGYLKDVLIPVYIIGYKTGLFSGEV